MSEINTGGPAFPSMRDMRHNPDFDHEEGMTLRDYFAAHAPEPPATWRGGDKKLSDILAWRWWYADEMLKARQS